MKATLRYQHRPPEVSRTPDPTAARLRHDLPALIESVAKRPDDVPALRTLSHALTRAATCASCAFRDMDGTCRAWPPRLLADGRAVWPHIKADDWCALWSGS